MTVYFPLLMIAFCVGTTLAWKEAGKNGISEKFILNAAVIIVISALLGSKLFHVLFDGLLDYYVRKPWNALALWRGGQVFYGGLIFASASAFFYCRYSKVSFLKTADLFAPGIALGLAITRIGCYFAGCCYGKLSEMPWAIQYGHGFPATNFHIRMKWISPEARFSLPIHPTQLYSVAANLAIFLFLWFIVRKRKKTDGYVFLWFLVLYGVLRSVIEIFRADPRGTVIWDWLSTSQAISAIFFVGGLVLFPVLRRKKKT